MEDGREDLADVVGDPEEKGFKLTLERKECIGVSDGQREGVQEGRGGEGEGSVPQGAVLVLVMGVRSMKKQMMQRRRF